MVSGSGFYASGADELTNSSERNCQRSLILVTNSLNLISLQILTQIQEICLEKQVKLNEVTFLKQSFTALTSCFFLENHKQMQYLFNECYSFGGQRELTLETSEIMNNNNSQSFLPQSIDLKEFLNLNKNKNTLKEQIEKKSLKKVFSKNKFLDIFMQYLKKDESDEQTEVDEIQNFQKLTALKYQLGEKENAVRFIRAFRMLVDGEQKKIEMTLILQRMMAEIILRTRKSSMIFNTSSILKSHHFSQPINIFVLLSEGHQIKSNRNCLKLSKDSNHQRLYPIFANPELSLHTRFQNLFQFSFSVYDMCLQHNSLSIDDEKHFLSKGTIKIHSNIQKIENKKTIVYRQKKQNLDKQQYYIMIINVPLQNQKFKMSLIPGNGKNKQIPRYALADEDIYQDIITECIFDRQFDCCKFSPHDIRFCKNLRNQRKIINIYTVQQLQTTADPKNNQFHIHSITSQVKDIVMLNSNVRYLCFAFRGKGQQVRIKQLNIQNYEKAINAEKMK